MNRRQSTSIDGRLSAPLSLSLGVPQGSILAPLLYILYTSDAPDLIHSHKVSITNAKTRCNTCGSCVAFIDDCSWSFSARSAHELSERLSREYEKIASYMAANSLVINDDKSHLIVFGNKTYKEERDKVRLQAGNFTIRPSKSETLLGGTINQDLKWSDHIRNGKNSLLSQLNGRINGLSLISKNMNFSTRLMVANAIVNSKLCYLIQVWGGTQDYLIRCLQVAQNRAMRIITGLCWFTPSRILLQRCKWLSVKQLAEYHTLLTLHKSKVSGRPKYLYDKFCAKTDYTTRQQVKFGENFTYKTERTRSSFCYRGASKYNLLPRDITDSVSIDSFKGKLKKWIKLNVPLE